MYSWTNQVEWYPMMRTFRSVLLFPAGVYRTGHAGHALCLNVLKHARCKGLFEQCCQNKFSRSRYWLSEKSLEVARWRYVWRHSITHAAQISRKDVCTATQSCSYVEKQWFCHLNEEFFKVARFTKKSPDVFFCRQVQKSLNRQHCIWVQEHEYILTNP